MFGNVKVLAALLAAFFLVGSVRGQCVNGYCGPQYGYSQPPAYSQPVQHMQATGFQGIQQPPRAVYEQPPQVTHAAVYPQAQAYQPTYSTGSHPQIVLEPGGYYSITPGRSQPPPIVRAAPQVLRVVRPRTSSRQQQQWRPGTVLRRVFGM